MMGPLKANVLISKRLLANLKNTANEKMAKIIFASSQLLMHHANDMLDQRIIDNGGFVPLYQNELSISDAIFEMIELMRLTLDG